MTLGNSQGFRLLVVDDDEAVRTFVSRVLGQRRYEVMTAVDGLDALNISVSHGPFDLLVSDLKMPGVHGDELARRLRAADPNLKILYLTGYADELFQNRPVLWNDEAFLEKPVTIGALLEAVALLLEGHIPRPRAARVTVPGARVQVANHHAELVTLSTTGILVHTAGQAPVAAEWPLILTLGSDTVRLTGRVVSCGQRNALMTDDEETAAMRYAVALAFIHVSPRAQRTLERVCAEAARGGR